MTDKWKIVPIEPTDEMWQEAFDVYSVTYHGGDQMTDEIMRIKAIYKAMLNAAPTQPKNMSINLSLAEHERLKKDAEIGKLVRSKMVSGNSIPVSRCVITHDEIEAIDKARSEP